MIGQYGYGTCSACGKRVALRPDGLVGRHDDRRREVVRVCAGSVKKAAQS